MQPLSVGLFEELAVAQTAAGQPGASYEALGRILGGLVGLKLFTVLIHDPARGLIRRAHTNMPEAYPVGGSKPIEDTPWMRQVLGRGEAYIGKDREDIREVFFDHELIWSLGCESVINLPVRWNAAVIGTLNLLHEAHWYDRIDPETLVPIVQFAAPGLLKDSL